MFGQKAPGLDGGLGIPLMGRARLADVSGMGHANLDRLLGLVAQVEGSDLHLKAGSPPRIRVDGELRSLEEPELTAEDTRQILDAVLPENLRAHFEERREADFAYSVPGVGRFRTNAFCQRGSVALVMRRVRPNPASFEELGLPDVVRRLAEEQRGLILVTGPTGSGKTTTLAAMIDHINRTRECQVITIEDPIEFLHQDQLAAINQREVGFDTMDFASALRAAMRQDPDVILVGEMRDTETVETALTAAETGHLVLSTLHTIDSIETVNRIVDLFPPHQQHQVRISLAGSLRGAICQRLVPLADGSGRVPALEVMVVNGRIQECIVDPLRAGEFKEI
ncbi:MAG TPA: PilT/PilU family type 4a pilus ATPase, partial [Acidimicrobiales bacterium]|nr:PilT/PilU family type 4a pilus ATPase [Acidimicrobiales bacterium]